MFDYLQMDMITANIWGPALPHAAFVLQAVWRGYKVRQRSGGAGRDARQRLAAVSAAAAAAPHRRIGARTRAALDVLLASKHCSQV
jgi:hypothetical protein